MNLLELEVRMSHLWAKSSVSPMRAPITLFRHSLEVVQQMAEYYGVYRPDWPMPDKPICLKRVLAYTALVHDFGKVHISFQAALRPGGPKFHNRHEILSLGLLGYLEIPLEELPWIEAAVALHHKNLFRLVAPGQPFFLGSTFDHQDSLASRLVQGLKGEDAELLRTLLGHSAEIFSSSGWPSFTTYRISSGRFDLLARIRESFERICTLQRCFQAQWDEWGKAMEPLPWPARRAGVLARGLIINADHLASFEPHPLRVGLDRVEDAKRAISSRVDKLNSHQCKAANQAGSAILVAPTGTGKTEAGLLWAARQAEGGLRGRTFVLLPYQASMNTMQTRLVDVFAPHFRDKPEEWASEVALVHGRSVRAAYEQLLEQDYGPKEASVVAHAQSDLARLNVAPLRVSSPFQIIRLLFAPKGIEGLIVALSSARLVFDEIHAYDTEVTALALTATRLLTEQFSSRVLFMTATLPSHLREQLDNVFGGLPVLTPENDVLDLPPRHRLRLVYHDVLSPRSLTEIINATHRGSVLVVVNQVKRAVELYRLLKLKLSDVHLLHSRFTQSDRFQKEKHIQPAPARVLVATQAVEVSLDLDYDACFSELAPLESLLQRFGRCNRRGRQGEPACVTVCTEFPSGSSAPWLPYGKTHLEETYRALRACVSAQEGVLLECELQQMLDSSYPEDLKQELSESLARKLRELNEQFVVPFAPFGMQDDHYSIQLYRQWEQLFDGQEVLPSSLRPRAANERSWLARARYFVPISGHKYAALKRRGDIEWDESLMCDVVNASYNEEGLHV